MKTLLSGLILIFMIFNAHAQEVSVQQEPIKIKVENNDAYYQNTVKVDSNIKISTIYTRALQFMAVKNFQQTYGFEQEGKLIFTSSQDLNITPYTSDNDLPDPYGVQFAITLDMKNGRYRYTIRNVIFFIPTENGNRRITLYEMYQKSIDRDSKRVAKAANNLIGSFERYITGLTNELYVEIQHKAAIYNSKF
jgi:hypothetical protein